MSKRKYGIKMTPKAHPYARPSLGRKAKKNEPPAKKGKPTSPAPAKRLTLRQQFSVWLAPLTRRLNPLTRRTLLVLIGGFLFGALISYFNKLDISQSLLRGLIFALVVTLLYLLMEFSITTAEKKGYSWWLGLLFFLVPPVVGLVIVLLLPRKTKPANP